MLNPIFLSHVFEILLTNPMRHFNELFQFWYSCYNLVSSHNITPHYRVHRCWSPIILQISATLWKVFHKIAFRSLRWKWGSHLATWIFWLAKQYTLTFFIYYYFVPENFCVNVPSGRNWASSPMPSTERQDRYWKSLLLNTLRYLVSQVSTSYLAATTSPRLLRYCFLRKTIYLV